MAEHRHDRLFRKLIPAIQTTAIRLPTTSSHHLTTRTVLNLRKCIPHSRRTTTVGLQQVLHTNCRPLTTLLKTTVPNTTTRTRTARMTTDLHSSLAHFAQAHQPCHKRRTCRLDQALRLHSEPAPHHHERVFPQAYNPRSSVVKLHSPCQTGR